MSTKSKVMLYTVIGVIMFVASVKLPPIQNSYTQKYLRGLFRARELVTATVYNAVPEQTNSDPSHTASMFKIDMSDPGKHRIVAVSRDLESLGFTLGKRILVTQACEMNGIWHIEDRMNKKYKKKIDFLVNDSIKFGLWNHVKIQLID